MIDLYELTAAEVRDMFVRACGGEDHAHDVECAFLGPLLSAARPCPPELRGVIEYDDPPDAEYWRWLYDYATSNQ
jgi:hypothetical protein